MHGGKSKRGVEHWNFKTGEHSKVIRKAAKIFDSLLERPVQVRIALYPEELVETMAKPRAERYFVLVSLPDESGLLLCERARILRAIRRQISRCLRLVREQLAGKPTEEFEEEE
jgi:hypothetical protein